MSIEMELLVCSSTWNYASTDTTQVFVRYDSFSTRIQKLYSCKTELSRDPKARVYLVSIMKCSRGTNDITKDWHLSLLDHKKIWAAKQRTKKNQSVFSTRACSVVFLSHFCEILAEYLRTWLEIWQPKERTHWLRFKNTRLCWVLNEIRAMKRP